MKGSEKLDRVIEYLRTNANAFAEDLGLKRPQALYDVLHDKAGISGKLASIIVKKYPQINIHWLLTGEGDMLLHIDHAKPKSSQLTDIDIAYNLKDKDALIEVLQDQLKRSNNNYDSMYKMFDEKIKSLELSLARVLSNQEELTMQLRAGLFYLADHFAGDDPKKKAKEKERIDTYISAGRK